MVQNFGSFYAMAQGTGVNYEIARRAHFEVDIQGIDVILLCTMCTLPTIELEAVQFPHFNTKTKVAANPQVSDVRIEVGDAVKPDVVGQLWTWFKQHYNPNTQRLNYASAYKKQGKILLYDVAGELVRTWTMDGIWMKKSPTPDENYDAMSHEFVKIALNLSVDNATLDEDSSGSLI